jgi:dipeptidyl aminopeptidase/acylaminoacyl peptidase
MPRIPVVRWLAEPPEVEWIHDEPPAQPIVELHLYEIDGGRLVPVDPDASPPAWWIGTIGWRPDGSELLYQWATEGGLREDIRAVDPETGASRVLHSESATTPVYAGREWYGWMDGSELLLSGGDRLLFLSEQSGSLQLYLKSLEGGEARQLTRGPGEVVRIAGVDEERGWVYYTAYGDAERPYDVHFFRVALDGSETMPLTSARASHEPAGMFASYFGRLRIRLSPSMGYFVARHSTLGRLPVTELRTTDGTLVRTLSEARLGPAAEEYGWQAPEEFVIQAADGMTDLWGVLWKPYDFDPSRRYPLIEVFYSGAVPRTFDAPGPYAVYAEKLAQLGFVTVMLEGRGSEGRGREFRDAFAGRPGGFVEDHAAALRQLVAERPYLDGSRIGAYGYSAGGEEALWVAVGAPDTYQASVSVAPTEPASPDASESLLDRVSNLDGPLLLVHATADTAAPVRFTMRFLDAAIRANERVDLLLVPDGPHDLGSAWKYAHDRVRDFFLEHLDP